jgi:polyisoprenoid-binding protein YceI
MKLVRSRMFAVVLAAGAAIAGRALAADTYTVDRDHSSALFRIGHIGISATWGRFNDVAGTFVEDADPSKASVEIQIKADSVDTNQKKRDDHLKSPDFFNAKQFPTLTFKSKSLKKVDEKTLEVTGDLTIHGVTKPLTTKIVHIGSGKTPMGDTRSGWETTFTIKRSDFDMKYGLDMDPSGDEVRITVALEGIKK